MNEFFDKGSWYFDEKMVKAVNLCMEAIETAGLSAENAALVPEFLKSAIDCSNDEALRMSNFKKTPVVVDRSGFQPELTAPFALRYAY